MTLDFTKPKKFSISMESYLNEVFEMVKDIELMQGRIRPLKAHVSVG